MFTVTSVGPSGAAVRGFAVLIDGSTALTLSQVVSDSSTVRLESVANGSQFPARVVDTPAEAGAVLVTVLEVMRGLEPFDIQGLRSEPFRLEATPVPPRTLLDTLAVGSSGFLDVLGVAGETRPSGLVMDLPNALPPDIALTGAPVMSGDRLVGLVADLDGQQLRLVPAAALLAALKRNLGSASAAPPEPAEPDAEPEPEAFPEPEQPKQLDELLAAEEPTLLGGIDSDLVVWDNESQLEDHLQIQTYVNMLSVVVAATETPLPLSIGLFGAWGSGKTYFMGLMRQAIKRLADQAAEDREAGRDPVSCARIVPITFNAWHYADANLWASLSVRIFDELAGREKVVRTELEQRRQALIEKLPIYTRILDELTRDRGRADERVRDLQAELDDVQARQNQAAGTLRELRIFDVAGAALDDPRVRELRARTAEQLKELGLTTALDDLKATVTQLDAEVKRAVTLRAALRDRGRVRALAWTVPVLLVLGVALLAAPGALRAVGGASLVAATGAAGRVTTWLQQRAGDLRQALNQVQATIAAADEARARAAARNRAEIEQAQREVDQARSQYDELQQQHAQAAAALEDVERQLADLWAGARLQRFIAERSASSDYRRQLGVVSMARRDFEDLTRVLQEAIREHRDGRGEAPAVDRIVLYVDDLDRCSAQRVVEVLEAVHLLLAMDLFVVVVGVDPRWLLSSVRERFHGAPTAGPSGRDGEFWQWTPHNYLEKIFQIPLVLPAMSPAGYQELLRNLSAPGRRSSPTRGQAPATATASPATPDPPSGSPLDSTLDRPSGSTADADPGAIVPEAGSAGAALASGGRLPAARDTSSTGADTPPPGAVGRSPLDLTPPEVELLGRLAPLVRTPRVAKRMLNIYRMLRVTRDLGPASRFLTEDHQAAGQLLSVLTGYPHVFGRAVWGEAADAQYRGLLGRSDDESWSQFVDSLTPCRQPDGRWANTVTSSLAAAELEDWNTVVAALQAVRPALTLPDTLAPYRRWAPRIARFSFELSPFVLAGRAGQ